MKAIVVRTAPSLPPDGTEVEIQKTDNVEFYAILMEDGRWKGGWYRSRFQIIEEPEILDGWTKI